MRRIKPSDTPSAPNAGDRIALRRRLRRLRALLSEANPFAGESAARRLPPSIPRVAETFAAYLPSGSEIDPGPLVRRLRDLGGRRLLPRVGEDGGMRFLEAPDDAPLAPDATGQPAPLATAREIRPDLVIAPLLAFDRQGGRLGQGGGHYDRALAELRRSGPVLVLGLAFSGQEVDSLALEAHDQKLDAVLTEAGYRRLPEA